MADKFVLINNGEYVEKGNLAYGLFKMNAMTVVPPISNNKINVSIYIVESFTL